MPEQKVRVSIRANATGILARVRYGTSLYPRGAQRGYG